MLGEKWEDDNMVVTRYRWKYMEKSDRRDRLSHLTEIPGARRIIRWGGQNGLIGKGGRVNHR